MSSDIYRRAGRGGAGNYFSQKDVEEATKQIAENLEAQNASADPTPRATTPTQSYAHLGRGGAGNWYMPSDLAQKGTFTEGAAPATTSVKPSQGRQVMGGRGGAGNFHGNVEDTERERLEAERVAEAQRKLEEIIRADVERGLAPPQKAYMGRQLH